MIDEPIFSRDICTDQRWPDVDDVDPDACTDQWWPDVPDVMGWDRLSSNPVADILDVLAKQAGRYLIWTGRQAGKSKGWHPAVYSVNEAHSYHKPYESFAFDFDFDDPTVETSQTRADVLAWKKKRNTGPATDKFKHRGRKKK